MKSFDDKVAAITGAASGIGRALALELARRRCHLALCDVNTKALKQSAEEARAFGVRVTEATVDVADRAAVYAWAERVLREYGRINIIFNNAGVGLGSTVEGIDYEDFEWIMGINFWGVVYGSKAFLPHLKASGDGHIVNVSSVFGLTAQPTQSAYNASKFAVRGFTEALRQEIDIQGLAVGVTCVHPGGIRTNIARASRFAAHLKEFLNRSELDAKTEFEKLLTTTPQRAAQIILEAVRKNKRRVLIGRDAYVVDILQRLFPAGYQRLFVAALRYQRKKTPRTAAP